ncbi:uncharacterized protein A4U43_C04F11620 [Asparagus officinalis]|uniref:Uncharacterized protein n=1 Tax=Asparagus officinalis TaxID=4686 RepID=A0A5P1F034_ASPOF|nr:uncharacterized protein A4U43_C04F11620 [Asparagus officinalis]
MDKISSPSTPGKYKGERPNYQRLLRHSSFSRFAFLSCACALALFLFLHSTGPTPSSSSSSKPSSLMRRSLWTSSSSSSCAAMGRTAVGEESSRLRQADARAASPSRHRAAVSSVATFRRVKRRCHRPRLLQRLLRALAQARSPGSPRPLRGVRRRGRHQRRFTPQQAL